MLTISVFFQTWTMSAVLINMFAQGIMLSYPTSLLAALNQPDSPIKTDLNTSSWLGTYQLYCHYRFNHYLNF